MFPRRALSSALVAAAASLAPRRTVALVATPRLHLQAASFSSAAAAVAVPPTTAKPTKAKSTSSKSRRTAAAADAAKAAKAALRAKRVKRATAKAALQARRAAAKAKSRARVKAKHVAQVQRAADLRVRTIAKRQKKQLQEKEAQQKKKARAREQRASLDERAGELAERRHTRLVSSRDSALPRRPMSTFLAFMKSRFQSKRAELVAANGAAVPMPAVSKAIAAEWSQLGSEEKARLQAEYQQRLEEYERKVKEYQQTQPPKRPQGAYIRFYSENHGRIFRANPGMSIKDIARLVAAEYRALPESERASLQSKFVAEQDAWQKHMESWRLTHPEHATRQVPSVTELKKQIKQELIERREQKNAKAREATATKQAKSDDQ